VSMSKYWSGLVGLYTEVMAADNSALRSNFFPPRSPLYTQMT
jgi:hypothetical protein